MSKLIGFLPVGDKLKMKSKIEFGFLALCVVLVLSTSAHAVSQPLGDSGWAFVVRSDLVEGGQVAWPYIYSVTEEAVTIQVDKLFNRPFTDGLNYPIIIEFEKISIDATPKIIIWDEYIVNETGSEWTDYHMHLIVNALNPQAGFDPSFIPDGDQFENVYYNSYYGYNNLPIDLNFEDIDGNGVPPSGENAFQPGYYGGHIVIVTDPEIQPGEHFGLKEIPTNIPEPATLILLGTAGIWIFNRKKH